MPEYLEDPSVLTKEKLKNELLANNVDLPGGNPTKDVYVRLYLETLTARNRRSVAADTFSSDEELPPPVVSRSRSSSSRKATRKTVRSEDLDVSELTSENLKDELLKYGFDAGPIVASTRKLYEKKLQKLLDQGPPEALMPEVVLTEIDVNLNGNSDSDRYSDKEEEITEIPEPEPEPEPEPTPVVERPVRSRGKTPVTLRTRSSLHSRVEKIVAGDQTPRVEERDVLKELFPNDINTPSGISATCRRPIHGAAARPVKSSDLWSNDLHLRTPTACNSSSSSYTESRSVHRVTSLPLAHSSSSSSRLVAAAAPPAGQAKVARRGLSLWIKLLLLATVAAFLFFVYQAMETDSINPFGGNPQIGGDSPAEPQVVGQ